MPGRRAVLPDDPWAPEGAEPISVDQDEATLLEQAGVDPSILDFDLIAYNDRPEFADLAAVIQDQLGQIGITVKIKAGEYASFEPDMLAGDFDAALLSRGYLLTSPTLPATCARTGPARAATTSPTTATRARRHGRGGGGHRGPRSAERDLRRDRRPAAGHPASVFLVHESRSTAPGSDVQSFEPHPLDYYVLTKDLTVG